MTNFDDLDERLTRALEDTASRNATRATLPQALPVAFAGDLIHPVRTVRRRHSRIWLAALAAAASVAAAAALSAEWPGTTPHATGNRVSTAAVPTGGTQFPIVPRVLPLTRLLVTVDPPAGIRQTGEDTTTDAHTLQFDSSAGGHYDVLVAAPGAWSLVPPGTARKVSVHEAAGFYGALSSPPGIGGSSGVGLAWSYAPDAWAAVTSSDGKPVPFATALAIANATHISAPGTLRVPVRITTMPSDEQLSSIETSHASTRTGQHGPIAFNGFIDYCEKTSHQDLISIDVSPVGPDDTLSGEVRTINGRTAYVTQDNITIVGRDFHAHISQWPMQAPLRPLGASRYSTDQMIAIAEGLDFAATMTDVSTWFDASSALTHASD